MAAKNYAMESVVYRTAGLLQDAIHSVDTNDSKAVLKAIEEYTIECSLTKVFCSEALDYIVDENVQIHGGLGYCEGAPERHYRDSRINRIFEGTNEINRLLMPAMLLRKPAIVAKMGLAGKKILDEAMSPSVQGEPEDLIERLFGYLNNAKKSLLVVSDSVNNKFKPILDGGAELLKHQMVLMGLADCMIEIYKMESVLAALDKNRTSHNENLVRLIFQKSLMDYDNLLKKLMPMCANGDELWTGMAVIKRFMKFTIGNEEDLCNNIAGSLF